MKDIIQELLQLADIKINGGRPWDITVHNDNFYRRVVGNVELALGETYMDGWWDCPNLDQLIYKILRTKLNEKIHTMPNFWRSVVQQKLFMSLRGLLNFQTQKRAFMVGEQHYDIDYRLYEKMLDKRMTYTCAFWGNGARTLEEAQEAKLELTCRKLGLRPGMKVLDIGCGWGSFAKYAAEKHNVSVVGVTISREQVQVAQRLCEGLPVEFHLMDYRDLIKGDEKFDGVVSLGMFEHVGYKNYKTYMEVASHVLNDDGIFLLHTIGGNRSTKHCTSPWIDKYIFPNGQIPSIQQIGAACEGNFIMEDWHNFGADYDKTLMAWHRNFMRHWDLLKANYDERFYRMWTYYLLTCAGSFRSRENQLWQIVLSKNGIEGGYTRPSLADVDVCSQTHLKAEA